MRRVAVLAVVLAVAIWSWHRHETSDLAPPTFRERPPAAPRYLAVTAAPPSHVRQLSSDERAEVAWQIRASGDWRAAMRASRPPSLAQLRDAMREAVPYIAGCYENALPALGPDELKITARMDLTGDPDVGTVIDVQQLHEEADVAVPDTLDDCLRSTLQLLELPPLAEGDHVVVDYPFVFRAN